MESLRPNKNIHSLITAVDLEQMIANQTVSSKDFLSAQSLFSKSADQEGLLKTIKNFWKVNGFWPQCWFFVELAKATARKSHKSVRSQVQTLKLDKFSVLSAAYPY